MGTTSRRGRVPRRVVVLLCLVLVGSAGCGSTPPTEVRASDPRPSPALPDRTSAPGSADRPAVPPPSSGPTSSDPGSSVSPAVAGVVMPPPGRLRAPLLSSDLLVTGRDTLPAASVRRIRRLPGVEAVERLSLATFFVDDRPVTYAAVDPASFRRYSPPATAQSTAVWRRVAAGEIALDPQVGRGVVDRRGEVTVGNEIGAPRLHVGRLRPLPAPRGRPPRRRRGQPAVGGAAGDAAGQRPDRLDRVGLAAEASGPGSSGTPARGPAWRSWGPTSTRGRRRPRC